jgi:TRAP transporter TAXI family solute receptor
MVFLGSIRLQRWLGLFLGLACLSSAALPLSAETREKERERPSASPGAAASIARSRGAAEKDVNDTTVGVVSGTVTGTYIQFASDLSSVLDQPGKLRVLAILGKGSVKNVEDILYVRGVDIGIVQSDVLAYLEKQNMFGGSQNRIQYITKLYNEEFHLLAKNDVTKLEDLAGKKVNFGLQGSGFAVTASIVFDLLKIEVEPVFEDPAVALEKLKKGEIAAAVGVYGKPAKFYTAVKPQDGLHFVPVPFTPALGKVYFPSTLTDKDYGDLVQAGDPVETVAVGSVMVSYGWPKNSFRYTKVARFVDLFFSRIEEFQKPPRHPKWQEVNLATPVPGWTRFPAADEWLKKNQGGAPAASNAPAAETQTASAGQSANSIEAFKQFLAQRDGNARPSAEEEEARKKLLKQFQEWQARRTQ